MISVLPVAGIGDVQPGDVIGELLVASAQLEPGDVVVVDRSLVARAEGRIQPAGSAAVVRETEAVRVLRRHGDSMIAETAQGFVCEDAGIEVDGDVVVLLPLDSDRSARRIRDAIRARSDAEVAVVVHAWFGRAWRRGNSGIALGASGIAAVVEGVAVADEVAAAASLVLRGPLATRAAIVRGVERAWLREGSVQDEIIRPPARQLFR